MNRVEQYVPPPAKPGARFGIRWMIRADLPACVRTELGSFAEPWAEEDFLAHLRHRNTIGMVATSRYDGAVLGHMIYTLHAGYLTMVRLAVSPDRRLLGVGRSLVERLQHKVTTHRRERIDAVVAEDNLPCQKFFRSLGWRAVGMSAAGIEFGWESPVVRWPVVDLTEAE